MMTDVEEIKRRLAELEEKKKAEKAKKKVVSEPYGDQLRPVAKPQPIARPVKVEEDEPEEEPEIENKEDLERFSGEQVTLTQKEFNAMMKHAELGQKVIESGMVEGIPQPVQPPKIVSQEPQNLGEQIQAEKGNAVQLAEEQQLPEGAFEDIAPKKKRRWFRRGTTTDISEADRLFSKPTILYYDTDNTCKLVTGKMSKDGSLQIDERLFDFSEGQPSILSIHSGKGRSSTHPFYILRYDNMNPIDVNDYPNSNPTPEEATRLVELKTLETLSRIEGGKMRKGPLIIIMLASFFGGFVLKMMLSLLSIW